MADPPPFGCQVGEATVTVAKGLAVVTSTSPRLPLLPARESCFPVEDVHSLIVHEHLTPYDISLHLALVLKGHPTLHPALGGLSPPTDELQRAYKALVALLD